MKKILLFGTMLGVAGTALAFGGVFSHGSKSSTYKGGVDAIGVHFGGEKKTSDSEKTKVTCSLPYTLNEEKNECECPAAQQCGETCCGEGNVCVDGNKCCYQDMEGNVDEGSMCCYATESTGYSTSDEECCGLDAIPYIRYYNSYEVDQGTSCCAGEIYKTRDEVFYEDEEMYHSYEYGCCTDTLYKGVGYKGRDVCCNHEPTDYTDNKGKTFKVCWDENTACKTNEDCATFGDDYYCDLRSSDCHYPTSGTCQTIGGSTSATVVGLGNVIRSNRVMSWWAADNWCKAQGKSLIPIEEFQVYVKESEFSNAPASVLLTEGSEIGYGYGCAEGKKCGLWSWSPYNAMWSGNTLNEEAGDADGLYKDRYSPVLISLREQFNTNEVRVWTASDYSNTDSCRAFFVDSSSVPAYERNNWDFIFHVLCK